MGFNKSGYLRYFMLLLILLSALGFAFLLVNHEFLYSFLLLFVFSIASLSLFHSLSRTNRKMAFFFLALRNEDPNLKFPKNSGSRSDQLLNESMNSLNKVIQEIRVKAHVQRELLLLTLDMVPTGIISFDEDGHIDFVNPAAMRILGYKSLTHINQLSRVSPDLRKLMMSIVPSQAQHINLSVKEKLLSLTIIAESVVVNGLVMRIISFSDIRKEIENTELESWRTLIRLLNHEITNTIIPITSISSTLKDSFTVNGNVLMPDQVTESLLRKTAQGLSVIQKNGEGLVRFVESYRALTRLPQPHTKNISVHELLHRILFLMQGQARDLVPGLLLQVEVNPESLILLADEDIIGQVLINLVKNAIESFQTGAKSEDSVPTWNSEKPDPIPRVDLSACLTKEGTVMIQIADNGCGMSPEVAGQIFFPFFTTKTTGSGIGLPLVRQLLRLHNATIQVKTSPGEGSVFTLLF